MRIAKTELGGQLEPGNTSVLRWPVAAEGYWVRDGSVCPRSSEARTIYPLARSELFLSFARLGSGGEPSEARVLEWVSRHGLLRRAGQPRQDKPENWLEHPGRELPESEPMPLAEFRREVRTMHQLLRIYSDVRARDGSAAVGWFANLPAPWTGTPPSLVDRYLATYRVAYGESNRVRMEQLGVDVQATHLKLALDLLRRCLKTKLALSQPEPGWKWWDPPHAAATDIGFVPWYDAPDLLTGLYIQFYMLTLSKKATRRCQNPPCRLPFPLTRKNRRFCGDTCRSNARNYR